MYLIVTKVYNKECWKFANSKITSDMILQQHAALLVKFIVNQTTIKNAEFFYFLSSYFRLLIKLCELSVFTSARWLGLY